MSKNRDLKREQELKDSTLENVKYIDSHFHFFSTLKENESLMTFIDSPNFLGLDIGTVHDDLPKRYEELHSYKNIYLSAGIGPWSTDLEISIIDQINIFKTNLKKYPVSAIGEIGLDNYWKYGTEEKQKELFLSQIDLAEDLKLPIIIHNRDADYAVSEIINSRDFKYSGIIHCFSSDLNFAKIALNKGFYISFAGPITYKKNEELREVLKYVPEDRLLLETDSPYLPPEPFRGKKNSPQKIPLIYKKAAEIKEVSIEYLTKVVERNFLNLLGDHKPSVVK